MRLFAAIVCVSTWLSVTSSPVSDNAGGLSRAAGCTFEPKCDATGEFKVPIPCEGFCKSYFFCQNGKPTLKTCPMLQNFNNFKLECDITFRNCDWWREDKPTDEPTSAATGTTDPNNPATEPTTPEPTTPEPITTTEAWITEAPCYVRAECDATGYEAKPIPCAGYCNKYYSCEEGEFFVKTCPRLQRFNNLKRACSPTFFNCDWYKSELSSSTSTPSPPPPTSTPTNSPSSTPKSTVVPVSTTKKPKPNKAATVFSPTVSLLLTVLIPLLGHLL